MNVQSVESKIVDRMSVYILESNEKFGQRAADDFTVLISQIVSKQASAAPR